MRLKTAERVSLNTPPNDWELRCIKCSATSKGYEEANKNFRTQLLPTQIRHSLYCLSCERRFKTVVSPKKNYSDDTPYELWVHRCGFCGELTVGKEHIDTYVSTHWEKKYQDRCKECDKDTARERRVH